jgi:hypothetical protein
MKGKTMTAKSIPAGPQDRVSTFDRAYTFHDEHGKELFEHVRWITNDERGKSFSYRWREHPKAIWDWHKPTKKNAGFDADDYLYRLPAVVKAVSAGEPVWWTEGERDALALVRAGVCGTSHHGAAGNVWVEQGAWLVGAREVVLCLDRDTPGAYCGLRRWQVLVEDNGMDPARIRVVYSRMRHCKDVRDHLALGHSLGALHEMTIGQLRKAASKYDRASAARHGYPFVVSPKRKP